MNGAPLTDSHPDAATLGAYHDGELRGFARAEVEAHLAACPRCRREVGALDALADALRSLPAVEPPAEIHEAVLARVAATRPRRRPRHIGWLVAAALAAVAALAGWYDAFILPHGALSPAASAPAVPSNGAGAAPKALAPGALSDQGAASRYRALAPTHGPAHAARLPGGSAVPGSSAPPGTLSGPATTDARLIARSGEVDIQVPDVQRAFSAVTAIATREGGYVADSNNDAAAATAGTYAATLTLRVPAANFQATLDKLAALPHRKLSERSGSQDITDSYRDLQASLAAYQATRAQLMSLMRRAHSVHDAIAVLDRLTEVNANIDAVQSQIMASANSVMLSTITVNLAPEPRKQAVVVPGWQPDRDLGSAVGNAIRAVQALITVAIYAAVYLALPALLAALALLARRLRRRALGSA